jgi:hypothetical protein
MKQYHSRMIMLLLHQFKIESSFSFSFSSSASSFASSSSSGIQHLLPSIHLETKNISFVDQITSPSIFSKFEVKTPNQEL